MALIRAGQLTRLLRETDRTIQNLSTRKVNLESKGFSNFKESDNYDPVFATGYVYNMNQSHGPERRALNYLFKSEPGTPVVRVTSGYNYDIMDSLMKDGYVYRSMELYAAAILTQEYELIGNKRDVAYVKDYLKKIEEEKGQSLEDYIRKLLYSIRKYGIAYTSIERDKSNNGSWLDKENYRRRPITGFYVEDAKTMSMIFKNRPFKINGYIQMENDVLTYSSPSGFKTIFPKASNYPMQLFYNLSNLKKQFPVWTPRDMIYTSIPTDSAVVFPMPPLYPAVDDLRSLRDIESILDMVIYQYGSPLIHVTADVDELSTAQTQANRVIRQLEKMEANGMIGTSKKVEVKVVDLKNGVADLKEYLEYYSGRLFTDIGVTGSAIGSSTDSSARATADIEMKVVNYNVEMYQDIMERPINNIIYEIIQTKYQKSGLPRDKVQFKFNRIDINQKIQEETHHANIYNFGLITRTEARKAMGYSDEIDEDDTVLSHQAKAQRQSNQLSNSMANESKQNILKLGKNQSGEYDPKKASVNNPNR